MKKLLLLAVAAVLTTCGFAQNFSTRSVPGKAVVSASADVEHNYAAKSTAWVGDSAFYKYVYHNDTMSKIEAFDSSMVWIADLAAPYDSGYFFGTNAYNMVGWGNYFSYHYAGDTMMKILGVMSAFTGTYTTAPLSTKTINFKVWKADTTHVLQSGHFYVNNFPSAAALYAQQAHIYNLGIGVGTAPDTINKVTWFTTPVTNVNYPFVVGYDMNYSYANLAGDTIGIRATDTVGMGSGWITVAGGDTILHAQTTINIAGTWYDVWLNGGQRKFNLSIIPIVQLSSATAGVSSITREDLTFFGTYPNPASNGTNVKFSLEHSANVTVNIMDMTGRSINTIVQNGLGAGEHVLPIATSNMAAGNYLLSVQTSNGGAIACQFTVAK